MPSANPTITIARPNNSGRSLSAASAAAPVYATAIAAPIDDPATAIAAPSSAAQLLPALARFDREGLAPFLPQYAACDVLAGAPVEVIAGDGRHAGNALGLAADGALRVRLAQGEREFHAGEVSLRRGAAA